MSSPVLYMDAVITPNQSLSPRGLKVVMGLTVALALIPFTIFMVMGAHFAPIFLGLDVVGLWFALYLATRPGGRGSERVQVSHEAVRVLRGKGGKERSVWSSPTAFTRIEVEGEDEDTRVWLRLSGAGCSVGGSLSPDERIDFAAALRDAVREARLERHA